MFLILAIQKPSLSESQWRNEKNIYLPNPSAAGKMQHKVNF